MSEKIFIGVAWPYANGPLHMGHIAGCYLGADIFARYNRMRGRRVLMVSGSDSHGTPITVRAEQEGITPEDVLNRFHPQFMETWDRLGITFDLFTTTHTENHQTIVQDIFLDLFQKTLSLAGSSRPGSARRGIDFPVRRYCYCYCYCTI